MSPRRSSPTVSRIVGYALSVVIAVLVALLAMSTTASAAELRVLSLNTWHGGKHIPDSAQTIAKTMIDNGVQVALLSETEKPAADRIVAELNSISSGGYRTVTVGNTSIVTNLPLVEDSTDSNKNLNKGPGGSVAKAVVNVGGQEVSLYAVHLSFMNYPSNMPRGYEPGALSSERNVWQSLQAVFSCQGVKFLWSASKGALQRIVEGDTFVKDAINTAARIINGVPAAVGQAIAGIPHVIQNPLAAVTNTVQALERAVTAIPAIADEVAGSFKRTADTIGKSVTYFGDRFYKEIMAGQGKMERPVTDADELLRIDELSNRPAKMRQIIEDATKDEAKGRSIIIGGDFNEASHLDWTEATKNAQDHNGAVVEWLTTKLLEENGYTDSYRTVYPDPLKNPGNTWPANNPLVSPDDLAWAKDVDERDRVDYIFGKGDSLELKDTATVGPRTEIIKGARGEEEPGIKDERYIDTSGDFPSDHKGLLTTYNLADGPNQLNTSPQTAALSTAETESIRIENPDPAKPVTATPLVGSSPTKPVTEHPQESGTSAGGAFAARNNTLTVGVLNTAEPTTVVPSASDTSASADQGKSSIEKAKTPRVTTNTPAKDKIDKASPISHSAGADGPKAQKSTAQESHSGHSGPDLKASRSSKTTSASPGSRADRTTTKQFSSTDNAAHAATPDTKTPDRSSVAKDRDDTVNRKDSKSPDNE